jgi:hypothetical protein
MAAPPLPPWLDIRPEQFTHSAIAGAQLGSSSGQAAAALIQRGTIANQEAAARSDALAQHGLIAGQEMAAKAQALQVQRESIAASLSVRQAADNQRSRSVESDIAFQQQKLDLQKQVHADAGARLAKQDALWQDGMKKYQDAITGGTDPATAEMQYLEPLKMASGHTGATPRNFKPPSEWGTPMNVGSGEIIQVNPTTGESRTVHAARPNNRTVATLTENMDGVTQHLNASEFAAYNANQKAKNDIAGQIEGLNKEKTAKEADLTKESSMWNSLNFTDESRKKHADKMAELSQQIDGNNKAISKLSADSSKIGSSDSFQPPDGSQGAPPEASAAVNTVIPNSHIEHLIQNPDYAAEFDRKYGQGSAAKYLDQQPPDAQPLPDEQQP